MNDVTFGPDITEVNDSEILRIEKVVNVLNQRQGQALPLESFRKEIIDRFAEIGFGVDVKVWTTNLTSVFYFDIEVQKRYEGAFDPDRQVHEVTNDLLDFGEGGVIPTTTSGSGILIPKGHKH